jgi:hypothetical protein
MTRDEFEEWLAERQADALDDMPQSDTTAQKWLARLYTSLKAVADQDDAEEADPDEDELFEDEDKDAEEDAEEKEEEV